MAGTALARQLTPPSPAAPLCFARAEPRHEAAIRRLLRDNPMAGAIRLTFEREPSYFAGTGLAEAHDQTILASAGDDIVCLGRCTERPCWLDGRVQRVGYLSELRLDRSARGRFDILRQGYRFFHECQRNAPADFYFTSIAADNRRARQLLERGLPGLPAYRFLADFVTRIVPVPRRVTAALPPGIQHRTADAADAPAMVSLLNDHAARHSCATHWSDARLASLARHGLPLDHFHLLWAHDRLVACAALWDQRAFRQTVIRGYSRLLRLARPSLNALARVTNGVELPDPGACIPHAFVSPLATVEDRADLVPDLVRSLAPDAAQLGLRLLTLGFEASDSRLAALRRNFSGREYVTRLYKVSWPDDLERHCFALRHRVMPEVALL